VIICLSRVPYEVAVSLIGIDLAIVSGGFCHHFQSGSFAVPDSHRSQLLNYDILITQLERDMCIEHKVIKLVSRSAHNCALSIRA
jgi:hypothetical protein